MKNIINLIKLNFSTLFSLKKMVLFLVGFSGLFVIFQPTMLPYCGSLYLMMTCYTIQSYEERSKMSYLISSLPVSKKDYVLAKYFFALINGVIALLISIVLSGISKVFMPNADIIPIKYLIFTILFITVFIVSILMPGVILLGAEKGRYILVFLAIIPVCFSSNIMSSLQKINLNIPFNTAIILAILISITLILASYFITSNIYSKKEVY